METLMESHEGRNQSELARLAMQKMRVGKRKKEKIIIAITVKIMLKSNTSITITNTLILPTLIE